jgi:DNA-binding protein Fis
MSEQDSKMTNKRVIMNTLPLKTEDVTKIDFFLNELFQSGKNKQQILDEVNKFCADNQIRREKILEMHRRTLDRKKKLKAHYENIAHTSKPDENQKNLIYFMQCLERVKMEVTSRKECDKNTLKIKNKVKQFNTADKRRIMELLL